MEADGQDLDGHKAQGGERRKERLDAAQVLLFFIGFAELAGAVGIVLPALTRRACTTASRFASRWR